MENESFLMKSDLCEPPRKQVVTTCRFFWLIGGDKKIKFSKVF